ncbi:MAG TPA: DUF4954 domain-containing protein, partial [Chitinophagaceae bacterium]|nr:DUF4954 domain-containing protein [Chitinophagaceae bacterium]
YGARLINSYLGDNSTISCCEVLNSLIFPAHEQHHNNSFLCASLVMGQSNMAAGATIGSNHNSRGADGELIAGRGFWPGLCVSLKHNSKFAGFTIIAKGDFPAELNIPIPFSLVSNDVSNDRLVVMPGYWFFYNMYALARNEGKYQGRDKRTDKTQLLEFDYLAPDTVNELFDALRLMEYCTGKAWSLQDKKGIQEKDWAQKGKQLLEQEPETVKKLEIIAEGLENSRRKTVLIKVAEAHRLFKELIIYYGTVQLIHLIERKKIKNWAQLQKALPLNAARNNWKNAGGQLVPATAIEGLVRSIRSGKVNSWDEIHEFYRRQGDKYNSEKLRHAFASLLEVLHCSPSKFTKKMFLQLLTQALTTRDWMTTGIYESRAKDYKNPFRQMVYETEQEMEKVTGKLRDNSFINEQQTALAAFTRQVEELQQLFA